MQLVGTFEASDDVVPASLPIFLVFEGKLRLGVMLVKKGRFGLENYI
jgi:hypothetical protein